MFYPEDERDENGMPTQAAVEAMADNVSSAYAGYMEARAAGDAGKVASRADKVRGEVGLIFVTLGRALGDLPGGTELDGPTPRTRMEPGDARRADED